MKTIAVVTCYFDPDYVRARTLRSALGRFPDVKVVVVKNTSKGLLRYPQVMWRLWRVRHREHPDAYLLTFRGQEMLPFVLVLAGKKPVWFDEFIVPLAYAISEPHHRTLSIRIKHLLGTISAPAYARWLKRCSVILADTEADAALSAHLSKVSLKRYLSVPVGTDEHLFTPKNTPLASPFTVFYYSTGMQPLHGIPTVLEAAEQLSDRSDIVFLIVGGRLPMERLVAAAVARGAHIRYQTWIPFDDLVAVIRSAGLCLGGPFGTSPQAKRVVTGKTYQFLACGVPVVVGQNEATDVLANRKTALVVPRGDAKALAEAVRWSVEHPMELRTIGAHGRELFEAEFSSVAIARLLRPLVASL